MYLDWDDEGNGPVSHLGIVSHIPKNNKLSVVTYNIKDVGDIWYLYWTDYVFFKVKGVLHGTKENDREMKTTSGIDVTVLRWNEKRTDLLLTV